MIAFLVFMLLLIIAFIVYPREGLNQQIRKLGGIEGGFDSIDIKIMEFNVENGGMANDFKKVVAAIKLGNADIVAVEEGYRNIPTIAQACGYKYHDTNMQILSRFPIYRPADLRHNFFRYIEVSPGRLIVLSNVHLTDEPYGPNALRAGTSFKKLTKLEKETRLIELEKHIKILPEIAESGVPVFLTGDFNVPSHLDCVKGRPCFDWPVSKHLKSIGFRDSFREANPSASKVPGHTWWVDREKIRGWNPGPEDIHDRIDFIYVSGPAKTIASRVIGEADVSPWPSDHRAVLSTFRIS